MKTRALSTLIVFALIAGFAGIAAAGTDAGVVNLNSATADQLQLLPRVGPALAGRILEFRQANGPFHSVDELVAVKGIGDASMETLRPYVTIEGDTTLAEKVKVPRKKADAAS